LIAFTIPMEKKKSSDKKEKKLERINRIQGVMRLKDKLLIRSQLQNLQLVRLTKSIIKKNKQGNMNLLIEAKTILTMEMVNPLVLMWIVNLLTMKFH
jgi:hypothetical protein